MGHEGNFLSVPTDCPQRDERLGWTGDLAVFAPTAAFLGDVESFLADWLVDARARAPGDPARSVPVVVPNVMKYLDTGFPEPGATAVWGDAAVWVPWALWQAYGHEQTLRDAYPLMAAHTRSRRRGALAETGCGTPGSSSATGSIPMPRPMIPASPRRRPRSSRRPARSAPPR